LYNCKAQPNENTKDLDGWFKAGSKPESYEIGKEAEDYNGGNVYYLKSTDQVNEGFGTIMRYIKPQQYIGKRLRLSCYIKTDNLDSWTGMWMRVDGNVVDKMLGFDNMSTRPIKGTTDWQKYEIVLDVPETAVGIAYGVLMNGSGQTWMNGISFDVVDSDVETTNMWKDIPVNDHPDYSNLPDKLKNIPDGIKVSNSPDSVFASYNKTDSMYYWFFSTSVSSDKDIEITEFGSYTWYTYQWVFGTVTGKPFGKEDFHEWYHCRNAKLKKGKVYTDNHNWSRMGAVVGFTALWYYIGKDKNGNLVKGTAIVDCLPELKK